MVSPGQGGDVTLIRTGAHKITIDPAGTAKTAGFTPLNYGGATTSRGIGRSGIQRASRAASRSCCTRSLKERAPCRTSR